MIFSALIKDGKKWLSSLAADKRFFKNHITISALLIKFADYVNQNQRSGIKNVEII